MCGAPGRRSMLVMTPSLHVEVVADGDASGGAYAVLNVRAEAGTALRPHVSHREDTLLFVLEGELEVVCADERRTLAAGDQLTLPRSTPRRMRALGDVWLLCLAIPAGIELLHDLTEPPAPDPDDVAARLSAAGIDLLPQAWGAPVAA
jgi:mannose-6-phosphate isomerase-like protein (cupin superfamily)